jgi:hypothetical protein
MRTTAVAVEAAPYPPFAAIRAALGGDTEIRSAPITLDFKASFRTPIIFDDPLRLTGAPH